MRNSANEALSAPLQARQLELGVKRELMDGAREDLISDLHARGVGKQVDDLVMLADTIIGLVLTTVESILDGRVTNRPATMEMMLRSVVAGMTPPAPSASLGASAA